MTPFLILNFNQMILRIIKLYFYLIKLNFKDDVFIKLKVLIFAHYTVSFLTLYGLLR